MAAMRYFKKAMPDRQVVCDNGAQVKFTTLDGETGWYADTNEYLHGQFEKHMREQRSGISEVSAEEFVAEYVQKKTTTQPNSKPKWREEWGNQSRSTPALPSEGVGAVAEVKPMSAPMQVVETPLVPQLAKPEFKPHVGRRKTKGLTAPGLI